MQFDPNIEYLDLSSQQISNFDILTPFLKHLPHLKELNLEDNSISKLPRDLSKILPELMNLNMNGNDIEDS